MKSFVGKKIRTALDNVLDHCSADGADIDLIEDFVLKELIAIATKELSDSREALWDEQNKFQRNNITSNVKLKELKERYEANVQQLKELENCI
jgi:homospermidine synthase|tara:strand:- start:106 stop:384 length:279 start_codon:yes stop_codon:yes gene_type:complete